MLLCEREQEFRNAMHRLTKREGFTATAGVSSPAKGGSSSPTQTVHHRPPAAPSSTSTSSRSPATVLSAAAQTSTTFAAKPAEGSGQQLPQPPPEVDFSSMARVERFAKHTKEEQVKWWLRLLQQKAYCRFRNVREAFRLLDVDKSGRVDRAEIRMFFNQFNLSEEGADIVFDSMLQGIEQQRQGSDEGEEEEEVDYFLFMQKFGSLLQPGGDEQQTSGTGGGGPSSSGTGTAAKRTPNLVYGPGWLRKLG